MINTIRNFISILLYSFILFLLATTSSFADSFKGTVIGIIDGDTVQVLNKGLLINVHLADVDAPEEGQAYGLEARDFTWMLVNSVPVTVFVKKITKSGETVGKVVLMNTDTTLNKELIKAGFAWWDWKHSEDRSYGDLEATAREFKVGLWKDEAPVPPWEFKKGNSKKNHKAP